MEKIVLSNISKSYSGVPAVRNLSVDIREGEFLTLLGPSGCGKTTTLRMIAAEPQIFLMDEPLSNLDAMLRVDMRSELKHLHRELGATTVYVTHDQVEALTLSDRIVVMNEGRLMQCDTPEQVYKKPLNLFVARFVGSPAINLIKGKITGSGDKLAFESKNIKLGLENLSDFPVRDVDVIAAVRAEDISIAGKSNSTSESSFEVYIVLPAGSETIVTIRIKFHFIILRQKNLSTKKYGYI